ncbi:aspartate/tyrosine/aromatic aminotransferase [Arsenicitalea aurantiaca]|uniref:Aspartate/tyrosine/aromatic aminotransferase n=1 Tax=Arsenicitalea aurantiaca TaxID=1783274 RepID=A0A433XB06_9HYPH|nr:amino acid aminotransferase [Arsenicitalea aurantiaca]RUT31234.1 aspartate/tyrosine/aromatic aminotransferase [Arsenicitalea aurantiaca]
MFETLHKATLDKIFVLMAEYAADPRSEKIDLGVGVYKDETGNTPIMSAVRKAEARIHENARTKTYVGVSGNRGFCNAIVDLVLADSVDRSRVRTAQGPGGTGALWILIQLLNRAKPGARVMISDPSWPNHWPMMELAGLTPEHYPYFDPKTRAVDFDAMLATLDTLGPDDIVLLHACCHNPTGANLTEAQWDQVAASLARTGAFPLLDLAYLGFGDGLEADAYAARKLASSVPEMMIAFSGSKNFGLYRERAGCAIAIARDEAGADIVGSQMSNVIRASFSQPPDHGAEIIRVILEDPALRAEWEAELAQMRERMKRLRVKLAEAIRKQSNATDYDFIAEHSGMFSLLGLERDVVERLKTEDGVYMINDSRINVAGIPEDRVDALASHLLAATRQSA